MRRPPLRSIAAALAVACLAALPAMAGPVRSLDPLDAAALELLRVFPEPLASADYVQLTPDPVTGESQYLAGLAELEGRYPDVISVDDIGDLVGMPGIRSYGGREIPVITVTDSSVDDEDKVDLYISMSIHGLERAGLEGGVRFIEDIAMAFFAERDGGEPMILANGDPGQPHYTELTATETLQRARLVFVNLNPDGWAAGDRFGGAAGFNRGNDNRNLDLNRQWPTMGWARPSGHQYNTMSESEAQAGRALIEEHLGMPQGAADLHGQREDDVLLAIMFPAGQFDPTQLARQVALAEAIKHNVNHSVFPGAGGLLSAVGIDVKPAEYQTAYDAIGYDDSGFQGDYLVQTGALAMDHEYTFSNQIPNHLWLPGLTQVHVDTTRELLKATIVTTIVAEDITWEADLGGALAYVHNPEVLTEEGAQATPGFGHAQEPYTSTSMRYWEDLERHTTGPVTPISSADVAGSAELGVYDTIVVTDRDLPRYADADGALHEPDRAAFWRRLRAFAEGGGNLVLTDAALQGLADLGLVEAGAVRRITQYAGAIQGVDRSHELLRDVEGVVGQTYFEVPLGYPVGGANHAPAWRVDTAAWQAAGGSIAGRAGGSSGGAALGTAPLGDGRVTIFGAVLPDASQSHPHPRGLADYAVTYAGNAILVNATTWTRP